jgi:hypothetical protein
MMNRSHPSPIILFLLALFAIAYFLLLNMGISERLPAITSSTSGLDQAGIEYAMEETGPPMPSHYLDTAFCLDGLCDPGDWQAWIILGLDSKWTIDELEQVRLTLLTTIKALDEAGFDGHALLSGTRFRRHHAEFIDDVPGRIARIYHEAGEIALADTVFIRLWGWYPYHELGHVIDRRLDSEPRRRFHALAGSEAIPGSEKTADGFWMNEHGRFDHGEAAADAVALWIVMRYTDNPKPVFWRIPNDTDYEKIAATMEQVMYEIAGQ